MITSVLVLMMSAQYPMLWNLTWDTLKFWRYHPAIIVGVVVIPGPSISRPVMVTPLIGDEADPPLLMVNTYCVAP